MGSIIDITFTSFSVLPKMRWWVIEKLTHNDHQAVMFEINQLTGLKWKDSLCDKDAFNLVMNSTIMN